ncbi:folylpolyglutamate synthase/dihydrofolate synthase family protein [Gramella sp. AN32]|uniref:Dihydrofolate synthase/folylpolyglutamate synthase n=1 Tax=Christiangramia antarctica TaxID=2058158 RepID=A0ABW5X5I0_9FLAO|nr:folylpolyglutamate synthase/dihydrofolate synthase family protein [Gramella sp. AN32]
MKNYSKTVEWMFQQLPMYQRVGASAYKKDLSNTLKLAAHLQNPHKNFKTIHVAGTNGKGSVSHMLASVLQEAGYKTGLYTSPHLKDFRERIRINGKMISEDHVVEFIQNNESFLKNNQLSFFEMTVGMAFWYFDLAEVDIAVIEVGLGGRLDSTNIITPEVSIITNIGMDHTAQLGNTLAEIAGEKAGIIKKSTPVIIGKKQLETTKVFKRIASEKAAKIIFAEDMEPPGLGSDLKGAYQKENIATVLAAISELNKLGWNISAESIQSGISKVKDNTGLRGRWEILQEKPLVICDTAHNADGLKITMKQLIDLNKETIHFVIGVVNDKNLEEIFPILPKKAIYYVSKPEVPRGLDAGILSQRMLKFGFEVEAFNSLSNAYQTALKRASESDVIYVGGSTFTVAEII